MSARGTTELTDREKAVLELYVGGDALPAYAVAAKLQVGVATVREHLKRARVKLRRRGYVNVDDKIGLLQAWEAVKAD